MKPTVQKHIPYSDGLSQLNNRRSKHLMFTSVITELLHVTVSANCKTARWSTGTPKTGQAIQSQVWADPEGSKRLWLPDFKTVDA